MQYFNIHTKLPLNTACLLRLRVSNLEMQLYTWNRDAYIHMVEPKRQLDGIYDVIPSRDDTPPQSARRSMHRFGVA